MSYCNEYTGDKKDGNFHCHACGEQVAVGFKHYHASDVPVLEKKIAALQRAIEEQREAVVVTAALMATRRLHHLHCIHESDKTTPVEHENRCDCCIATDAVLAKLDAAFGLNILESIQNQQRTRAPFSLIEVQKRNPFCCFLCGEIVRLPYKHICPALQVKQKEEMK